MYTIRKYRWRFWAVYCDRQLVCVTVYRKGAVEVARRLNALSARIMEASRNAS